MAKYIHKSEYFYGNKISDYGLANGYVDYATLAKAFNAVMVNDITKVFCGSVNGEYSEVEQVNGFVDYSNEIEELQQKIEDLELQKELEEAEGNEGNASEIQAEIESLEYRIEDYERWQDEQPEIFQYFVISDGGAELLQEMTDEIVYYLPVFDCYVWGVTHCGTSWDYVLTDIEVELDEE